MQQAKNQRNVSYNFECNPHILSVSSMDNFKAERQDLILLEVMNFMQM